MKKLLFSILFACMTVGAFASFDQWFENRTLRMDYYHTGNYTTELYAFNRLIAEPYWGGSHGTLIDTSGYGKYLLKAYDQASGQLIYSRGYCTLFDEWQFTEEAKHITRTFGETVVMPFPKKDVRIEIFSRSIKGVFEKKFEHIVKVTDYFILNGLQEPYPVYNALASGDPSVKVDIVILPEGYTADEMVKFKADCDKFAAGLFEFEPFSHNRDKFNICAVLAPSRESGTDIPADHVWKNTIMNSSFYTFDSERYLMTPDNTTVRDLAANAPYDQIYLLVNSTKYGGGSIYNHYSTSVNSNQHSAKIFVHEFGHGFAGLGDEYDDGSTSYNDLYPLDVEPWEPNITTLVQFEHKWKSMLDPGTTVPTPADKENPLKLGVYEGAGYVAKGIYRPTTDCMMRTFKGNKFCPVCSKAIQGMIDWYTK